MKRIKLIEDFWGLLKGDELCFNEESNTWEFKSRDEDIGDGYESIYTSHISLSDLIIQQNINMFEPVGCYNCKEESKEIVEKTESNCEEHDRALTSKDYYNDIIDSYSKLDEGWKKLVRTILNDPYNDSEENTDQKKT